MDDINRPTSQAIFEKDIIELIKVRRSIRNYSNMEIEKDVLKQLTEFMAGLRDCPFGSQTRFQMLDMEFEGIGNAPGTYGVIKGAKHFVTGAIEGTPNAFVDFGYLFEKIILFATGLGLATCWMGGTIKRSTFGDRIALKDGEIMPAISPVGYPSGRKSVVDSLFRFGAKSSTRKPWPDLFFQEDFETPLSENAAGDYATPLEMLRLAPSASNRQPWRIIKDKQGFHLFLQRTKTYDKLVKDVDLQRIDMGIAMCHFELSARASGIDGKWQIIDNDIKKQPEKTEYIASWV